MCPVTVIVPFSLIVANILEGFTWMISIGSVSVTALGTVLIMRSNNTPQVSRKKSFEAAIFWIRSPPSDEKILASERVVTLWPNASGF